VKSENNIVEGVLYEIPDSDLKTLDRCEGYPSHYGRIKIIAIMDNGEKVEAVTYVAKPDKVKDGLKPSREYLDRLLKGCDLLSEEYCKKLREWRTSD
jgi:gamma-glutamylcyclotransferase (GGCT)/AIG2-like uncharacterized protein YtfP